jgi:hypothetical protein
LITAFATGLLPNGSISVYCGAYGCVNLSCRIFLHPGQDVAIEIEGYAHSRMPEAFLRDLRMYTVREKMGGMSVSEILKSVTGTSAAFARIRTNS